MLLAIIVDFTLIYCFFTDANTNSPASEGNLLDIRYISFKTKENNNNNNNEPTNDVPDIDTQQLFEATGNKRDLLSTLAESLESTKRKKIKYPIKDLAPLDDDDEGSGSDSKGILTFNL